ncbi:hypothetical protein AB4298_12745 [Shewanella sp. 10N.261.52.F9]|uniref:hypothetical protein n=1 Tax=Shewanella sp. 10N.261.52.F9 TaxID=3229684 RepID=UPI00354F4C2C
MNEDDLTIFIRKALNILFVSNPRGTSIGVFIGVILDGLIGLFSPALKTIEFISISAIKIWHLMGLGVFSMNLPAYLRRKQIDPSIVNAMEFIEEQKTNAGIPDWQVKQMYTNLFQKVLENMSLDSESEEISKKIRNIVTEPDTENKSNK